MNRLASWWVAALTVLTFAPLAYAQWSTDPYNNLIVGYGLLPELCSDSAGGCYITYEDNTTYPRHLILHRLDRYGYKPWSTSGKQLTGLLPQQFSAKLCEDGQHGVIVSYVDLYTNNSEINPVFIGRVRVQRIDSSGNFLWGTDGVRVSVSETNQYDQEIVTDGVGGCIVAWVDTGGSLFINRLDSVGQRVWGDSGQYLWHSPEGSMMISDGLGGCIIAYGAARIQRFDANANKLWGPIGIQQSEVGIYDMAGDGAGGLIIAGMKYLSYNGGDLLWRAMCQRIDTNGKLLWSSTGLMLNDSIRNTVPNPPFIATVALANGDAAFEWFRRTGTDSLNTFTQRVRAGGSIAFGVGGERVSTVVSRLKAGGQWIVRSGATDVIHVWPDNRSPMGGIYAQLIDSTGKRLWNDSDVALCLQSIGGLRITTDGNGGAILIGWRESDFTVRAQQVSRNGNLGEVITSTEGEETKEPSTFYLYPPYPNPFNSNTIIRYRLPKKQRVSLIVYDIMGNELSKLYEGVQSEGEHTMIFDGEDVASGVYLLAVEPERAPPRVSKLLLVR